MPDAPEIKVKLTAEDTGVSAAIKELTAQLKNLKGQQDQTASSAISLSSAFRGIVAGAAVLGLARIGKEAFDSAIDIGKMADKTGLTTQTMSVFHKVAGDVSVATEAVDKGLVKAAKSITQFEQGLPGAAQGFAILGIKAKDFAGLKPDEKIRLVTEKLGGMTAGFQKNTAAQLIFLRGGSEMIPVLNALAAQGFDKATEATRRLGLLLDQTTTDQFRAAKASMQELAELGQGMATQFEAGLLPAISDVGEALLDSTAKGGSGFEEVGKVAGNAIRGIAYVFFWLGDSVGAIIAEIGVKFGVMWDEIKTGTSALFEAFGQAARGDFTAAWQTMKAGVRDVGRAHADEALKIKAIWDQTAVDIQRKQEDLFPSEAEEKNRAKARIARLRPEKQTEELPIAAIAAPSDAAARAAFALLEKQLQDELAIHRAYAKQTEQIDAEAFEKGEISLKTYFDRRRAEVQADAGQEVAILRRGMEAATAEAQKAALAKGKAGTPKEADKQEALRLQALGKVEELQTRIREIEINSATKVGTLNAEEFKKRQDNQQKILEFHRLIDQAAGRELEAVKQEIAAEAQKMAIILRQSGETDAQVQAEIAKYSNQKMAEAEFEEAERKTAADKLLFETQRKGFEIDARNGLLTRAEAEKKINDLIAARLPLLQKDASAEIAAAGKTGNQENVAKAQAASEGISNLVTPVDTLAKTVRGDLSRDFDSFFSNLTRGSETVGRAFRGLAASIVQSFAKIAEQQIMQKLLGGGGGGGGLGGLLGGFTHLFGFAEGGLVPIKFAEGGLIKGAGGPKSDSIPARVSPGEYIVKADAVTAFGVANLEAINRGLKIPALERLALPKFAEGGLVGNAGVGGDSNINLGIGLDEGLILKHLSSKAAGNIVIQHLVNNPKAAGKALSRSQ